MSFALSRCRQSEPRVHWSENWAEASSCIPVWGTFVCIYVCLCLRSPQTLLGFKCTLNCQNCIRWWSKLSDAYIWYHLANLNLHCELWRRKLTIRIPFYICLSRRGCACVLCYFERKRLRMHFWISLAVTLSLLVHTNCANHLSLLLFCESVDIVKTL